MREMKKNLIAFIGTGPYHETLYEIEYKQYTDRLAFIPLYKHFSPVERVYVIGTKESRWEMLNEFPHTRIVIPLGKSESDFWGMFDILTENLNLKNSEVIFDITHCFRAIPLFTAIYIRFLRYSEPSAVFSHIFYGSFEKNNPITPIVDLAPTLEMLDWIDATNSFTKYGELEDLARKIREVNDREWKSATDRKPRMLSRLSKKIEELSNLSRLTYVPLLSESAKEISLLFKSEEMKEELSKYLKPFRLLTDGLERHISRFDKPSFWKSHLEAAKWYLQNKRPTQSLLVLREAVLTALCERDGCDPYDLDNRVEREKKLNAQRRKSKKPLIRLWQRITDARNKAGHALMRYPDKEVSVNKAIREVAELVTETENVLGNLLS